MKKMILTLAMVLLLSPSIAMASNDIPTDKADPSVYKRVNEGGIVNNINFSGERHYYNIKDLSELQELYKNILAGHISYATIQSETEVGFDDVVDILQDDFSHLPGIDTPERWVLVDGNEIQLRIAYADTESERKQTKEFADKWVSENITPDMTDRQKAEKIYYFVSDYKYYKSSKTDISAAYPKRNVTYALIEYGKGTCNAHAGMFQMLADRAGLECKPITGYVDKTFHIWNIVKIDGVWLHVDSSFATHYPAAMRARWFLKDSKDEHIVKYDRVWNSENYPEVSDGKAK